MTVLITGSRDWDDKNFVCQVLNKFKEKYHPYLFIVQGMCRGVDLAAKTWCEASQVDYAAFYAHWGNHGRYAGPMRNMKQFNMMEPEVVLAFHPNISESRGTKHMISYAQESQLKPKVMILKGNENINDVLVP